MGVVGSNPNGEIEITAAVGGRTAAEDFVAFIDVEKSYGGAIFAVRDLNLTVGRGEFLTFLGPSGSGKTTTLNMLAGFERPTRGSITLEGRPVDRLPPYERNIGMVFQNYALFPHMSVAENVAFPLSVRKTPKEEMRRRVRHALEMVRLEPFGDRRPAQLSGGQQQRVALARAMVFEPSLVLMDEPLGALDKKLREHMQIELKQLHDSLGITIIYVTHDQSEALTMSDRVAVFESGSVVQIGTPDGLYNEPASAFVANFIGENNTLPGTVEHRTADACSIVLSDGRKILARPIGVGDVGSRALVAIRPERIALMPADANGDGLQNRLPGTVSGRIYLGDHLRLLVRLENEAIITVKVGPELAPPTGESVTIAWTSTDCRAFPVAGQHEKL
jgi:putative spermidine/putrescine transport system ATP-binding protein